MTELTGPPVADEATIPRATEELLKLLLDPARLAVVGALRPERRSTDDLVAAAGVDRRVALEALAALVPLGVARRLEDGWALDEDGLRAHAQGLPRPPGPDPRVFFGLTDDEAAMIAPYFEGHHLRRLPASRTKRAAVLERLALEFEPGRRYAEQEVNDALLRFNPDYTTLRRALVDAGLLDRADGEYWRSGGRV